MSNLTKSKFLEPYKTNGGTALPNLMGKSGVYLIKSKRSGKIVYVGYSGSNLYKTLYRHFQSWEDKTQVRTTYRKNGYLVRVVLTTPARAGKLERALICKLNPKDNPLKYESYNLTKSDDSLITNYEEIPVFLRKNEDIIPF